MIFLLALIGCIDPDAPIDPNDTTSFVVEIPKGATGTKIGPELVEKGLVPSAFAWKMYMRQADLSCLKAGRFEVSRSLSMNELRDVLCGPPLSEEISFTVVEGWRIRDIDAALVEAKLIEPGAYQALAEAKGVTLPFEITSPTLEGYLYPETYRVPIDEFDTGKFIERQLKTFQDRFLANHPGPYGDRDLHAIVVMASMLEREEPSPKNRPIVAGVLWKRIDNNWKLGVDATSRYTLDKWNDRKAFLKNLRDPDDPYNTRLRDGLPPTAIGNPSIVSLEAALAPVASEFWYYLHDGTGTFHGAKDANGHEANRKKYDVY